MEVTITTENLEQHYADLTASVKKDTLTEVLTVIQTEIDTCYSEWKKHTDKPTPEELTIQAAQIQTLMKIRDAVAKHKTESNNSPRGTYECFHCLSKSVIWDSDFNMEDMGYEGSGVVHVCHCGNCGAEIEYICRDEEEQNDDI